MGELSKLIGEYGERVTSSILKEIGWTNPTEKRDMPCSYPKEHHCVTHGMDFLVRKSDPLVTEYTQNTILISSKYGVYPKSPNSKIREFLLDMAKCLKCLSVNQEYGSEKIPSDYVKKFHYSGVLFWMSPSDPPEKDLVSELTDFRNLDLNYPIYIVDNIRANFLLNVLAYTKNTFLGAHIEFFYPSTGLNTIRYGSGSKLPLQFVNSPIVPMKVTQNNPDKQILLLHVRDSFDEDSILNIFSLAQDLTQTWANQVIITFPDYHKLSHEEHVLRAIRQILDEGFANRLEVRCYNQDFRSLEAE